MKFKHIKENIRIAIRALRGNTLRSALTILGVMIGVAAVVLLLSVGQAVEGFVVGQFSSIGSNLVFVFGAVDPNVTNFDETDPAEASVLLSEEDYEALSDPSRVPAATLTGYAYETRVTATHERQEAEGVNLAGVTANYIDAVNTEVVEGRSFTERENRTGARVAVIGQGVADDLFGEAAYPVNREFRVDEVTFEVIGVLQEGTGVFVQLDDSILIPATTAQQRIADEEPAEGETPVTSMILQAQSEQAVPALERQIRATLRETRDIDEGDEPDFQVLTQQQVIDTLDTVTQLLTVFLTAVAGISLVVGGIGVMNIMLVTVSERTKEIGLRKAMGAKQRDILVQFLTESVSLTMIGGVIGLVIAAAGALLATVLVDNLTVTVDPLSVVLGLSAAVLVGGFFGAYPASRAARLDPIDALRHE